MLGIIENIPNVETYPLTYVFENLKLKHKPNTLWLAFGVASGNTVNYISRFTNDKVYAFDNFEQNGRDLPKVNCNIELISGKLTDTLLPFMQGHNKPVSFIHMDAGFSTKYILDVVKKWMDTDCILVFDEFVNYPGFDGENGVLKVFYEFISENNVDGEWIGMNGKPIGMSGYYHENVALILHSITECNDDSLNDSQEK